MPPHLRRTALDTPKEIVQKKIFRDLEVFVNFGIFKYLCFPGIQSNLARLQSEIDVSEYLLSCFKVVHAYIYVVHISRIVSIHDPS